MRLILLLGWDLLALVSWPLRALARALLGRRAPRWVEVRLHGALRYDGPAPRGLRRLFGVPRPLGLPRLRRTFERAARAGACRGLVLKVSSLEGSHAQLAELGRLIRELRAAGKEVVVWAEGLDGRSYAALAGATRLHLPPGGTLDLVGVAAELTSAGSALARLGVRAEFFRRESHKTAPELFTRAEPSPAQLETVNALLDEAYDGLLSGVSQRGVDRDRARALVDGGPYTGRGASAAGLLDGPLFWDELPARLDPGVAKASLGAEARLVSSGRRASSGLRPLRRPRQLALVPVRGLIRSGKSSRFPGGPQLCGHESVALALEEAREDRRVAGILLFVDSRGGSAAASELIWREVRRAAAEKPVVAYVDSVAASGGYYVACGARRILAAPLSLVGSIGVFFGRFDISDALGRLGVRRDLLTRGERAGLAHPVRPLTEPERQAAEGIVEEIYQDFLGIVAAARGRTVEEIRPLAGGRVYSGRRAAAVGLIDRVATFDEALAELAKEAGLPGQPPRFRTIEQGAHGLAALRELALGAAQLTVGQPMSLMEDVGL